MPVPILFRTPERIFETNPDTRMIIMMMTMTNCNETNTRFCVLKGRGGNKKKIQQK